MSLSVSVVVIVGGAAAAAAAVAGAGFGSGGVVAAAAAADADGDGPVGRNDDAQRPLLWTTNLCIADVAATAAALSLSAAGGLAAALSTAEVPEVPEGKKD